MPRNTTAPTRITDPWRAKLVKKTPHALMQLEHRGEGIVARCHCDWTSKPVATERKAFNAHARHEANADA